MGNFIRIGEANDPGQPIVDELFTIFFINVILLSRNRLIVILFIEPEADLILKEHCIQAKFPPQAKLIFVVTDDFCCILRCNDLIAKQNLGKIQFLLLKVIARIDYQ